MTKTQEYPYKPEEIRARLARELPHWTSTDGAICRHIRTGGWRATLMVVNAIGHLAELAWHHPELEVAYAQVTVRLSTHTARGVTDKDFALAHKIEACIFWRPGREGGALDGLPEDDPHYRYVLDDADS